MSKDDKIDIRRRKEDQFYFFRGIWTKIEEETINKMKNKLFTWSEHITDWIMQCFEINEKFSTSHLFVTRSNDDFIKIFLWIQNCVVSGAYHTAIRELRYLLEMMIQAYFLDSKHPKATIETKIEILKALENLDRPITGGNFIDKTDLDNKKKLKELYKELSGYIHPSAIEIQSQSQLYGIGFDEELFNLCVELSNEVMTAINEITEKWKEVMQSYL
jgi:hypothetical protein